MSLTRKKKKKRAPTESCILEHFLVVKACSSGSAEKHILPAVRFWAGGRFFVLFSFVFRFTFYVLLLCDLRVEHKANGGCEKMDTHERNKNK